LINAIVHGSILGDGTNSRKAAVTEEARKKQSELMKGNKLGTNAKGKSKVRTPEHNEKIRKAIKEWHASRKQD